MSQFQGPYHALLNQRVYVCVYAGLPTDCRFFKEGSHQTLSHKKASHRSHTDPQQGLTTLTHNKYLSCNSHQKHTKAGLHLHTPGPLEVNINTKHKQRALCSEIVDRTNTEYDTSISAVCPALLALIGRCWSLLAAFWLIGNIELVAQHISERNHSDWGCSARQISA